MKKLTILVTMVVLSVLLAGCGEEREDARMRSALADLATRLEAAEARLRSQADAGAADTRRLAQVERRLGATARGLLSLEEKTQRKFRDNESKISRLAIIIRSAEADRKSLRRLYEGAIRDANSFRSNLMEIVSDFRALNDFAERVRADLTASRDAIASVAQRLSAVESARRSNDGASAELARRLAHTELQVRANRERLSMLTRDLRQADRQIAGLRAALDEAGGRHQQSITRLEVRLAVIDAKLTLLFTELRRLRETRDSR